MVQISAQTMTIVLDILRGLFQTILENTASVKLDNSRLLRNQFEIVAF
jgi:hypothetical protein